MTDRERLIELLSENDRIQNIDQIVEYFLNIYGYRISISTIRNLTRIVNDCLDYKLDKLVIAKSIANERAYYIKTYLEGGLWPDEETAKKNLQPQIDNAQAIIDACKEV